MPGVGQTPGQPGKPETVTRPQQPSRCGGRNEPVFLGARDAMITIAKPKTLLRGPLGRMAKRFKSSGAYRKTIRIFEDLVTAQPSYAPYLSALHNDMALRLWRAGRRAEALDALQRALAVQVHVTGRRPTRTHRDQLAAIRGNLEIVAA
jgi:hypothetical protein